MGYISFNYSVINTKQINRIKTVIFPSTFPNKKPIFKWQNMYEEKISKAINSALKHLTGSIQAATKNEKKLEHEVWHTSSELEYTLLLFSLTQKNPEIRFSWKSKLNPKKEIETKQALMKAQKALKEAKKHLRNGGLEEAYKATWTARNYVFRVQEYLEKERKKKLKAKTTLNS